MKSKPPRKYIAIAFVPVLSPWLGIVARLLTADPWRIGLVGIVLWFAGSASFWYLHLSPEVAEKRSLGISILVWTLTFVPVFGGTAFATGMVIGHS
jgi:hypothetical protein